MKGKMSFVFGSSVLHNEKFLSVSMHLHLQEETETGEERNNGENKEEKNWEDFSFSFCSLLRQIRVVDLFVCLFVFVSKCVCEKWQ